ncbi:MAG TPA: RagB/SusD family nutrient uptake outer membrane protein [Flavilitoribacter sp.]|nr:RagB/SusD family nutrient uptake outer membrane protein [Flavilitoribacter sp.]
MKRISLIILSAFLIWSCDDQLDLSPISDAGSNGFYQNENDFTQAVNGIYATMQYLPDRYIDLDGVRSDNIYAAGQAGVRDWNAINNFLPTIATLTTVRDAWNITYQGIMRANTVLDQLEANPGAVTDAGLRARFQGEAHFLWGLFYFDLVKWFGKVPIFDTFKTPEEALNIGRSPVEEVYSLIIADLEFAIDNLPEAYTGANAGRATSLAAKGILARVYMTRSGPKLHPEGPCLGTNEYDKALGLLNDIIGSGRFSMLNSYAAIFDYANEGNAEIVWDLQYIGGGVGAGALYPTGYYDEGWGRVNLPFPGGNPGDGSKRVSDDLMNLYEPGDTRRAVTVLEGYTDAAGATVDGRFFYKFINPDKAGGDRFDWPINYPMIRYTDVLMLKAECILQGAGGSQGDVDQIVNDVRARAGLGPVSNVTLDMLLAERRVEFAGENLRWDDLVRTGKAPDVMNAFISKEDNLDKMEPVTANSLIYPVPQIQIDVKKGLYDQNPGYN